MIFGSFQRRKKGPRSVLPLFCMLLLSVMVLLFIHRFNETVREKNEAEIQDAVDSVTRKMEEEIVAIRREKEAEIKATKKKMEELVLETSMSLEKSKKVINPTNPLGIDACRDVFKTQGQGGNGEMSLSNILDTCKKPLLLNVCEDLKNFTGLTDDELHERLGRKGRFHFEGEHLFWNPSSATELAWYYTTSVDYLFANAVHGVWEGAINKVAHKQYEPVLEYSAGVGNNVLYLAKKGIKVQYFGVGMAEYAFAQYRVWKYGLEDMVEFKKSFSAQGGYAFDPINSPLPRDGSLGSIIAMDVLEHIPKYHIVVEAMVNSVRVGGIIIENTPFANDKVEDGEEDLRVHVSNGGVTMAEAMGPKMKLIPSMGRLNSWEKISE
mmetsp:Transcript_8684/g.11507  ORF Transcript_8684/g.11507 Transcript_8684/m.11507 type:complete len:380 (+) Transcript_8684:151-1290(+)